MGPIVEKLGVRAAAQLVFAVGLCLAPTAGLTAQARTQSPVRSEGGQSPSRVLLDTLVAEAVANNPEIAAARHRFEAARERPAQERSLPDPTISMGYDSSGRPWPGAGLGTDPTSNIGAMVTQEIPFPGKRDLRASVAAKAIDIERAALDETIRRIVAQLKQSYYRLSYADAVTGTLTHHRELLGMLLKVAESRYSVGGARQADVLRAQAELTMAEIRLERMQQERVVREAELRALLAREPGAPIGRPAPLDLAELIDPPAADWLTTSPALRREAGNVATADAAVAVARKDYKPDFAVSAGYYWMGSMPSMYMFRFDVRVPLQRERRAAAVRERASTLAEARSAYTATERDLQKQLDEDVRVASTSLRLARLYRDTALPQAQLALEAAMSSYETGALDFSDALLTTGSLIEYEMSYFDELVAFHSAAARLEAITGRPMTK
jgi:outer membrane protein TolC